MKGTASSLKICYIDNRGEPGMLTQLLQWDRNSRGEYIASEILSTYLGSKDLFTPRNWPSSPVMRHLRRSGIGETYHVHTFINL